MLGEKVGLHRGLSVLSGFIGVLIVLQPTTSSFTAGHLSGIMAAIAAAVNSLITRRIGQKEKTAVMLLYPMFGNFILMGAVLPFVYVPMPIPHLGGVALISCLGFMAMFCIVGAYKGSNASVIAPMQYSQSYGPFFSGCYYLARISPPLYLWCGAYHWQRVIYRQTGMEPEPFAAGIGQWHLSPDIGLRPVLRYLAFLWKPAKNERKNKNNCFHYRRFLRFVRLLANKAIGLPLLLLQRETLLLAFWHKRQTDHVCHIFPDAIQ